ncbi:MAG: hypothetical protein SGPRY_001478 [Prymnesium sp.]
MEEYDAEYAEGGLADEEEQSESWLVPEPRGQVEGLSSSPHPSAPPTEALGSPASEQGDESSDFDDEYLQPDIFVVCHQPEDDADVEPDHIAMDEASAAADPTKEGAPATPITSAHGTPASMHAGVTPNSRPSRHKEWINPKLQLQHAIDAAATPPAGGEGSSVRGTTSPAAGLSAAQRAKLGPLAHVPGGAEMDLSGASAVDNIDLDSLPDKPWRNASVDVTDYFNYGFTEDTWRLYCQRQQELRAENRMQSKIKVFESGQGQSEMPREQRMMVQNSAAGGAKLTPAQMQAQHQLQMQAQMRQQQVQMQQRRMQMQMPQQQMPQQQMPQQQMQQQQMQQQQMQQQQMQQQQMQQQQMQQMQMRQLQMQQMQQQQMQQQHWPQGDWASGQQNQGMNNNHGASWNEGGGFNQQMLWNGDSRPNQQQWGGQSGLQGQGQWEGNGLPGKGRWQGQPGGQQRQVWDHGQSKWQQSGRPGWEDGSKHESEGGQEGGDAWSE